MMRLISKDGCEDEWLVTLFFRIKDIEREGMSATDSPSGKRIEFMDWKSKLLSRGFQWH